MTVQHKCPACGHRSGTEELRRSLYLGSRTIGDLQAARSGTLGRRLIRRSVTRRLMRSLWGS